MATAIETFSLQHKFTSQVQETPILNFAQLHFLRSLSFIKTEEELNELQKIVRDFYLKKMDEEVDRLWDEGKLSDSMIYEHMRTPYT
jgi:hypothetical protein